MYLRSVGRFYQHRKAWISGPFDLLERAVAPRVLVSAEALAFRPNRGIYLIVEEASNPEDGRAFASGRWATKWGRHDLSAPLLEIDGLFGVLTFGANLSLPSYGWAPRDVRATVCYCDRAPCDVTPAVTALLRASDALQGSVPLFAGPLESIVPWKWNWFE